MKSWQEVQIEIPGGARGEVDVVCPECSSSRKKKGAKCLSVNLEKGTWLCHHCAWRGSLKDGAQGNSNPWTWKPKVFNKPTYPVGLELTDSVREWFARRGISSEILDQYQVSGGCVYMPQTEQHENVIQFPYFRRGELVNVKYRSMEAKDFRMVGGAERILFGLDDLEGQTRCVIVEGEMDKLALAQAGVMNVLSVPDGAPMPGAKDLDSKLSYLTSAMDMLEGIGEYVLMTDNDAPGVFLREELTRRLGADRCSTVVYPDACKDANDVLLTHGAEVLRGLVDEARPVPVAGVVNLHEYDAQVQVLYESGVPGGESTGWPSVDLCYTVKPGQLTIVTGVPSHGKSSVIDAMLVNIAKNVGWRFGLFSPENYPPESHVLRLIEKYVGKSGRLNAFDRLTQVELAQGREWIPEHFWFFGNDEDRAMTVDVLLDQAKSLVRRQGIRGIVIDPWNEVDHTRPKELTETEYISQALTKFRKFARTNGVHVWLVAHPTKMYRGADGQYPVPTPYDIAGSAHFRNKADNCLTIWRDDQDSSTRECIVYVQKIRFREVGMTGNKSLLFVPASGGFEENVEACEF